MWRKWWAPLIPLQLLKLSAQCSAAMVQGYHASIIQTEDENCFPSYMVTPTHLSIPPFTPPRVCSFYVWQQYHLLVKSGITLCAMVLPLVSLQGRAATSLGCTGCSPQSGHTQVSFMHMSEPHFIWNWSRPLIQNYTGGLSVAEPSDWDPILQWEPKQVNTKVPFHFQPWCSQRLFRFCRRNLIFVPAVWDELRSQ